MAQNVINIAPDPIEGPGPFGNDLSNITSATSQFTAIISTIIGTMTIGAGIWFVFQILTGAIAWIGASGEKDKLQMAQKRITNAVVGLVIVVAALVLVTVVGSLLGFEILNIDLTKLVPS